MKNVGPDRNASAFDENSVLSCDTMTPPHSIDSSNGISDGAAHIYHSSEALIIGELR